MDTLEKLSRLIEGYYTKNKIDKTSSLLFELRSGKYYNTSKVRSFLIESYKRLILSLSTDEYIQIKQELVSLMPHLIQERNNQKIAYSLLSDIIVYSCFQDDIDILLAYEKEIIRLVNIDKDKYFFHVITLAQTRKKLTGDISNIEDLFIKKYLVLSRMNSINYGNLIEFTSNVSGVDKRKILIHLMKCRPFRNDYIINSFMTHYEELHKMAILI